SPERPRKDLKAALREVKMEESSPSPERPRKNLNAQFREVKMEEPSPSPERPRKSRSDLESAFKEVNTESPSGSPERAKRGRPKGSTRARALSYAGVRKPSGQPRVKATPRRRVTVDDGDDSKYRVNCHDWYDGMVSPGDLDVQKLVFQPNSYFLGKYKIIEQIYLDEKKGATYIVTFSHYELVLRVNFIQIDDTEQLVTETKFLEKMELNYAQHFFGTMFDSGYFNKHKVDGLMYYTAIYRGGPKLTYLQHCTVTFSEGTLDRIASQIVKIFEQIFGQGYCILAFDARDFTVDGRSRAVFLNNYKNVVRAPDAKVFEASDEDVKELLVREQRNTQWAGPEDYAPIAWHENGDAHMMSEMDALEALVYMLIDFHTGALPWKGIADKVRWKKAHSVIAQKGTLIRHMPPALKCLWLLVRTAKGPGRVDFPHIHRMFTRYITVAEADFCYDWESAVFASDEQEALVNLYYKMKDMKRKMAVMKSVLDNHEKLQRRKIGGGGMRWMAAKEEEEEGQE
ncbi:hypothetical protein PFISCL1PPCAC_12587, partial [Pristionchus fissidentatus]